MKGKLPNVTNTGRMVVFENYYCATVIQIINLARLVNETSCGTSPQIWETLREHLPWAGQFMLHHLSSVRWLQLWLSPFYRWGSWNLPETGLKSSQSCPCSPRAHSFLLGWQGAPKCLQPQGTLVFGLLSSGGKRWEGEGPICGEDTGWFGGPIVAAAVRVTTVWTGPYLVVPMPHPGPLIQAPVSCFAFKNRDSQP